MATSDKYIPGSDIDSEEIFIYPFFKDDESKEFIKSHGKIMFIVRGPPGTGKKSLANMFLHHYPTGVKCSADDYFTNTFNSAVRTNESLKNSHVYCHKRAELACQKGTHPVIISNTHVKKSEMQMYLNYAAEYGYTVIIANTLDKFKVSPEILAKSNTKGLGKVYFEKRLKSWQDILPILMGWFLGVEDSFCLFYQLQSALDALLGDGKFCRVYNAFDKDDLLKYYKAKEKLFCIAGFMKNNVFELKDYYKSVEVRDAYGKGFSISVQAYVITKSDIFAFVQLDGLKHLTFKPNFENSFSEDDDATDIVRTLSRMSLKNSYNFKFIPLENDFSQKFKSACLKEKSSDYLDLNLSSFIHLAQREEKNFSAWELNRLFRNSFNDISNEKREVCADQFNKLEDGYEFCRLFNDAWLVKPPNVLSVNTVFTGLYI